MKSVSIIGAGPAGIEAASVLAKNGMVVNLFEKSSSPLKNVSDKAFLFPNFAAASDIVEALSEKLLNTNIVQHFDTEIDTFCHRGNGLFGNKTFKFFEMYC